MLLELQKEKEWGRDNANVIAENLSELTKYNPISPKILKQDQKGKKKSAYRRIIVIQNRDREEILKTARGKKGWLPLMACQLLSW